MACLSATEVLEHFSHPQSGLVVLPRLTKPLSVMEQSQGRERAVALILRIMVRVLAAMGGASLGTEEPSPETEDGRIVAAETP